MDQADLAPLLEELTSNITALEAALQPLLGAPLSGTASKLPLLDRARLYALATYAIESLLFSHLRLGGTDARAHPVFTELARVRQYFEKIKKAEGGTHKEAQNLSLDKQAAGRFIKHALAGNERYDAERAEREARERERAKQKLEALHGLDDPSRRGKRKAGEDETSDGHGREDDEENSEESSDESSEDEGAEDDDSFTRAADTSAEASQRKKHRVTAADMIDDLDGGSTGSPRAMKHGKKGKRTDRKRSKRGQQSSGLSVRHKSNQPPKSSSQAFQALLKGPPPKVQSAGSGSSSRGQHGGKPGATG